MAVPESQLSDPTPQAMTSRSERAGCNEMHVPVGHSFSWMYMYQMAFPCDREMASFLMLQQIAPTLEAHAY